MADPAVVSAAGTGFGNRRAATLTDAFGSIAYLRPWYAQVVSPLGNWIGLIAVTAIAAPVGGGNAAAAVGPVRSARVVPGPFPGSWNPLPHLLVFQTSVFAGGVTPILAASLWPLPPAALAAAAGFGVCAGAQVSDDLRGRIAAASYTSTRLCLFLALVVAPFVSALVDDVSPTLFDRRIHVSGLTLYLPGVRVALWLGGTVILLAGGLTRRAVRSAPVTT